MDRDTSSTHAADTPDDDGSAPADSSSGRTGDIVVDGTGGAVGAG
ncbi:hypothetical protein [Aeromicrobium stalagmiti]|nr:hypothetical protein [Aeromicrobium stalagmiti]